MEEEKSTTYYNELTRKGEGATRFKKGLGFSSIFRNSNDTVPARGSALVSSSSFLNSFVRASSPSKITEFIKQVLDLCFLTLEEVSKVKNLTKRVVFLSLVFLAKKVVVLVVVLAEICSLSLDLEVYGREEHEGYGVYDEPYMMEEEFKERYMDQRGYRGNGERVSQWDQQGTRHQVEIWELKRMRLKENLKMERKPRFKMKKLSETCVDEIPCFSCSLRTVLVPCHVLRAILSEVKEYITARSNTGKDRTAMVDYRRLIEGYEKMTPAERVKAKMKLQLSESARKEETNSMGSGWERFDFDKDAPLDDEEIEAVEDDGALVNHTGKSFRFSAVATRRGEKIKAAHDEAIFGAPSLLLLPPSTETDDEAEEDNCKEDISKVAPAISLISGQALAMQQGSWRDRARRS
ncbi:hypothetical protein FXO38_13190 [Capsicum annuum]|nr:hypothetical protein FXO37_29254 [Capsicum annuum]KAF3658460.1 hypothetical protein FXO38_13190 [Capsicum annuum]